MASEVAVAVEEWWWCCTDSVLKSWFGVRSAAAAEERGEEAWAVQVPLSLALVWGLG